MLKRESRRSFLWSIIALLFLAAGGSLWTAGAQSAKAVIPIDAKSQKVLKEMSEYLERAKTFRVKVMSFHDLVRESGIEIKVGEETEAFIQRPNKMHVRRQRDDQTHSKFYFDGSMFAVVHEEEKVYSTVKFAGAIDALLDHLIDNYDLPMPMADFFYSDVYGAFHAYLISGEYLGRRLVDGVLCHHLSFESTGVDWQLWVEVGEKPLPRRFVITYLNLPGEPEFFAKMTEWELNPQIDEGMFSFAPPKDAKKIPIEAAKKKK